MVKYIEPSVEILSNFDGKEVLKLIERAGRTCYKSEDLITDDSAGAFVKMLIGRDHMAMIEHFNITVKFIVNRGFTHEAVRHRLASFAQESTRYVNYSKDKSDNQITVIDQREIMREEMRLNYKRTNFDVDFACALVSWREHMERCENEYIYLIKCGFTPEMARGVLPIDLKAEIVMTANLREWRHIFDLRCANYAHPFMRFMMRKTLKMFHEKLPIVFDDLFTKYCS
jgi:thymidylate synthase (FAD)